jgi:TolB-like protein/tetratricopeptide (TPR) repeat protein
MTGGRFYQFGPFRLDAAGHLLFRDGKTIALAPKVADTLVLLVENAGQVLHKEELLKRVWRDAFIEEGSLTRTISVLRKTLGEEEYIATISKRGYRFAEPVRAVSGVQEHAVSPKIMLAVLPFEDFSPGKQQEYFSDGLTEEMITELGRLNPERLGVIARTSAMRYKGTEKSIQEIGRELGVSFILEGSVRREATQVRIAAQLIQVSDQTHVWAETYQRPLRDILTVQSEVAQSIARQIRIRLTPEGQARVKAPRPIDPEAYEHYLRGRYLWNQRSQDALERSVQHFKTAIRLAPAYAPAYVGLADSYLTLGDQGFLAPRQATALAKTAARRALRIAPSLAEPHISLGHAYFHEFNWRAAEREFRSGLELNPSYAIAYFYYANYLAAVGRTEEAVATAHTAHMLDPVSAPAATNRAMVLYFARRLDEGIAQTRRLLENEPAFTPAYEDLGRIYQQQSRLDQAIPMFEKAVAFSQRAPRYLASLAHALALVGRRKEALKLLRELERQAKKRYVGPYSFSLIYVSLGDKRRAFSWLEKAYRLRDSTLPFLNVDPRLDSLHSDLRFRKLLRRIGLARPSQGRPDASLSR